MDLFKHQVDKGGPIGSRELETLSGGEEQLIGTFLRLSMTAQKEWLKGKPNTSPVRFLRALCPMGVLDEVGEKQWQATPVTVAMASEGIAAGYRMVSFAKPLI
jgi:hypothetical protein